jgi:hypothetical protein
MTIFLLIVAVIIGLCVWTGKKNKATRIANGVPEGFKFLNYKAGSLGLKFGTICAWSEGKILRFSSKIGENQTGIPFDKILKVNFNSDVQTVTSGGGRSVGGAVVGGVILGPLGAIVGSRSKAKTHEVDRSTVHFSFMSERNIEQALIFEGTNYNKLLQLVK